MSLSFGVAHFKHHKKTFLALGLFYIVQLCAGAAVIYFLGISQTHSIISGIVADAKSDIVYSKGEWDTSAYDSDPEIPGNYRIYVIAKDGFIIDRWRPIGGYLDTSDFRQLMTYQTPTTVHTIDGQTWRLLSLPLMYKGSSVGAVTVGKITPNPDDTTDIDAELQSAAAGLAQKASLTKGGIDVSGLNTRSVPYDVSFQIVDQYNRIKLKSNHSSTIDALPNYIDPSYIAANLQAPSLRMVHDDLTGDRFLTQSSPLLDANGAPFGTVIVARTIEPYLQLLRGYLWADGVVTLLLLVGAAMWLARRRSEDDSSDRTQIEPTAALHRHELHTLAFSKETCAITINERQVPFTYATNQYCLCLALFSKPYKKWEVDELLEKLGLHHTPDAWRKVYDTMVGINKKCNAVMTPRLIVTSNKTYQINPALAPLIAAGKGKESASSR